MWNYISGYVKICILGLYPERLINRAANAGIPLLGARCVASGAVECGVPMRRFKSLRACARGSGCRIRIIKKRGLPLAVKRILGERTLCLCAAALAILSVFASSRIWFFDIECGGMEQEAAFRAVSSVGCYRGMPVKDALPEDIADRLDSLDGVLKAKAVRCGVTLRVFITGKDDRETQNADPLGEGGIYAERDCVITSISVSRGRAMVSEGQSVKRGQLLISGDRSDLKEGYRVSAEGEVFGRIMYRASATVSRYGTELIRTGRSDTSSVLSLPWFDVELDRPYDKYDSERIRGAYLNACPIPAALWECKCFELVFTRADIGSEAAKVRAAVLAQERIFDSIPKNARILSLQTEYSSGEDGSVTACITATTLERVGVGKVQ